MAHVSACRLDRSRDDYLSDGTETPEAAFLESEDHFARSAEIELYSGSESPMAVTRLVIAVLASNRNNLLLRRFSRFIRCP